MNDLMRHRGEFARAIANQKFEISPEGLFFPGQQALVAGVFDVEHRRGGDLIGRDISPNLVVTEGLNSILSVVLAGGTQINPWYLSPFEGNYTPVAGLTAATFTAAATECTAYDEAARVAYVEAAPSGGVITNAASRAEFTFNATKTIYGAFIVSSSVKAGNTGVLLSIARFNTAKTMESGTQFSVAAGITLVPTT